MNNRAFSKIGIIVILVVLIAGGILAWQYFGIPKEKVKTPEGKVPEEVIKDETADWKTYRDEELGFEIKYPERKYPLEEAQVKDNIISFRPLFDFDLVIGTEETLRNYKSSKESLETFLKCYPGSSTEAPVRTKETVKIDNIEFCLLTISESAMGGRVIKHNCYWTKLNNKYLVLDFNIFSVEDKEIQTIINQMLATLRFLK